MWVILSFGIVPVHAFDALQFAQSFQQQFKLLLVVHIYFYVAMKNSLPGLNGHGIDIDPHVVKTISVRYSSLKNLDFLCRDLRKIDRAYPRLTNINGTANEPTNFAVPKIGDGTWMSKARIKTAETPTSATP